MDFREFLQEFEISFVGFSHQKVGKFLTVQEAKLQGLSFKTHVSENSLLSSISLKFDPKTKHFHQNYFKNIFNFGFFFCEIFFNFYEFGDFENTYILQKHIQ